MNCEFLLYQFLDCDQNLFSNTSKFIQSAKIARKLSLDAYLSYGVIINNILHQTVLIKNKFAYYFFINEREGIKCVSMIQGPYPRLKNGGRTS